MWENYQFWKTDQSTLIMQLLLQKLYALIQQTVDTVPAVFHLLYKCFQGVAPQTAPTENEDTKQCFWPALMWPLPKQTYTRYVMFRQLRVIFYSHTYPLPLLSYSSGNTSGWALFLFWDVRERHLRCWLQRELAWGWGIWESKDVFKSPCYHVRESLETARHHWLFSFLGAILSSTVHGRWIAPASSLPMESSLSLAGLFF